MINVRFACGHGFKIDASVQTPPTCPTCGERRVSRVTAPAPTFTGVCSGPSATTAPLAGIPVAIPKET